MGLRSDFSFVSCFFFFLLGILVCRGVLNVTSLASSVFVMALMTAWELASFGTLK